MVAKEMTQSELVLIGAPEIPGLVFRRFRGEQDYPKMHQVLEAVRVEDKNEHVETVKDIARHYTHLTNCDPTRDMVFAEVDEQVIGYSRVFWYQQGSGERIYHSFGTIKPEWRGQGLGRAMLRYNQRRLYKIAIGHPEDGQRFFEAYCSQGEFANRALLESDGYQPARHFFSMVRPNLENIAEPQLPAGLEVRPVQPEHIRQIWDACEEAFQDHWGFSQPSEEEYQSWLEWRWLDPSLWRVAWDGDQVAGMVRSFISGDENEEFQRLRGYTEDIAVRRPWRKRGLARALLLMSLQAIKERGMMEAALGVDTENLSGALRLYESAGFRQVRRNTCFRKVMD